jgi:HK97 family phage portal protein
MSHDIKMAERLGKTFRALTSGITDPASWLIEAFGGGKAKSGVKVSTNTVLGLPAVWFAAQKISGHLAGLPLNARKQLPEGGTEVQRTSPGHKLLNVSPNNLMTPFQLRELMMIHALLLGNGRAYIERNGFGQPIGLIPVLPENCQTMLVNDQKWHLVSKDTGVSANLSNAFSENEYWKVPDRDMLHIMGMSYNGIWGMHVIDILRDAFGLGIAGQDGSASALKNSGRPGMVITAPPGMFRSSKEASEFLKNFEQKHEGVENSGKVGLLREGMSLNTLPISASDAQFIEQRQFQRVDLAMIFGLESILGDETGITYKSITERNAAFINGCLSRWFCKWEEECNRKLLPEQLRDSGQVFYQFDTTPLLKGDPSTLADYTRKMREQFALSTNEVREMHGFNPVDGLNDDYTNEPAGESPELPPATPEEQTDET